MATDNKDKYTNWITEIVGLALGGVNLWKESGAVKEIEKQGYDTTPLIDESIYLVLLSLMTALEEYFPKDSDGVFKDIKRVICETNDGIIDMDKTNTERMLYLNEKLITYLDVWQDALEREKFIKDDSLLNNSAFTVGSQASLNAYGKKIGNNVIFVTAFSTILVSSLKSFRKYFKEIKGVHETKVKKDI